MSKRRIVVFSNANGKNEIYKNADFKTWGELRQDLIEKGIWSDNLEAVIKGTRQSLVLEDASLPETDFTVFLVVKKMKSGNEKKQDALADLTLEQLQDLCRNENLKEDGVSWELRKRLRSKAKTRGYEWSVSEIENILDFVPGTDFIAETPKQHTIEKTAFDKEEAVTSVRRIFIKASAHIMTKGVIEALDTAQISIIEIIEKLAEAQTEQEVYDAFESLTEEWKEVQRAIEALR